MIYASFCPNKEALVIPEVREHIHQAYAYATTQSTDEDGLTVYTKANNKTMAIIIINGEVPSYLSSCTLYELPSQLAQAKAKAQAEGIIWSRIPQILGSEFL